MAKIGMPWFERGSMKESRTPVCENGNGPSSLRQIHRGRGSISFGMFSAEQTMDSSSAVRVIEVNSPRPAQDGKEVSGASRTMAYGPGRWENLRWWQIGLGSLGRVA